MTDEPAAGRLPVAVEAVAEETVDGVPVVAEARALDRLRPPPPVARAVAVGATGFVAGAATFVFLRRHRAGGAGDARLRLRRGGKRGERLTVVGTQSFLLDVHMLGRE